MKLKNIMKKKPKQFYRVKSSEGEMKQNLI